MNVLEDISFEAKPGETVAFIGSTGSGKSTLINLLPRFFDVTEGAVRYGGTDIREFTQKDLRDLIGYVPQKGVLFSGTVESNLKYADENASEETMRRALEVSQARPLLPLHCKWQLTWHYASPDHLDTCGQHHKETNVSIRL